MLYLPPLVIILLTFEDALVQNHTGFTRILRLLLILASQKWKDAFILFSFTPALWSSYQTTHSLSLLLQPFSFIFPTYQSFLWTQTQSRRIPRTLTFSQAGLEAEQYPWACLYILDYCKVIEKDQHLMTCLLILSLASKPYKNKQSKILLRVSNTMLLLSKYVSKVDVHS